MSFIRGLAVVTAFVLSFLGSAAHAQLTEVANFGSNPGELRMFRYVPANLPRSAPVVVMIHGCAQTPADVDTESGWIQMADTYKFAMVFPQTTFVDPAGQLPCYRSYDPAQNRRGAGEALSIKQMTDWMKRNYSIDGKRVFVTGFSSGAHMTSVMMATYPDVFAAGGIVAGHPYRCAATYNEFVNCNIFGSTKTAQAWGDLVRSAYPGYRGSYPRVAIWGGTSDIVVRPTNAEELVKQWTNVHGIDQTADEFSYLNGYLRYVYKSNTGAAQVERYSLPLHGHAIPVNVYGPYQPQCGTIGGFATQNSWICSSYYISKWFGLAE